MFSLKYWRNDLQASLVVFLVALPLCLGIALASNAPLAAGLIAGILGGLVVGSLSGSPVSVSGPAAGLTVIVINSLATLGNYQTFILAVAMAGVIQIIFGLCRGGVIGNYFPSSVIKGMLAAIGIILILKQFPHAVGYDADFMGDESFEQADGQNTFSQIFVALRALHPGSIIISLFSLTLMILWDRFSARGIAFFKLIPGALVAVIGSILINLLFVASFPDLALGNSHLVQLPFQDFSGLFSGLTFPDFSQITNYKVYVVALTIAIVGSLESLLSVDAADKLTGGGARTNKNRELFAQGTANTISGLIGGLPITAVIVRTSANASAGAKTHLSAMLHGLWLFLCVGTIASVLNQIPLACLASVLLMVGYKLTKPSLYKKTWEKGVDQFFPFVITVIAILFTDLLVGISIGMVVGFFFVIKTSHHQSVTMVNDGDYYLIRFYKDVSFLSKTSLQEKLDQVPDNSRVVFDGSHGVFIDDDIIEMVEDFISVAPSRNIAVDLKKSSTAVSPMFKQVNNG